MQPYDIFMLVVLIGTTVFGAWKGMAWQLASFASLVVSGGVAVHASPVVAPMLGAQEPWNRFLAMLILFLATSFAIWVVFRFVAKLIDRIQLKEFDRQMGALFGLLKGVALCLVLTFFAVTLSEKSRSAVLDSRSGFYTAKLIKHAGPILPDEVKDVIGKYIDELERGLNPDTPESKDESDVADRDDTSLLDGDLESRLDGAKQAVDKGSRFVDGIRDAIEDGEQEKTRISGDTENAITDLKNSLDRGAERVSETLDRGRGAVERVGSKLDEWRSQSDDTFR